MDVRPRERVADAFPRVEVCVENLALLVPRQLGESLGGGVRERAADAEKRLKRSGRVDEDADLRLQRLAHAL